jgi:hypothetical protein
MHAVSEPPVTAPPLSGPPLSPLAIGMPAPPREISDQRRVVIRLRDGETILVGGAPTYEDALVLAQRTILRLEDVGDNEWPLLGDRFVNPEAIVSVDVLRWG